MGRYKQIIAVIIIVIITIIFDFILQNNTNKIINELENHLSYLDNLLEKNDANEDDKEISNDTIKEINDYASGMRDDWKEKQKILTYYIEHDEIEKIGCKVDLIEKQIKIESYQDASQAITETKFLIEHLNEKQKLTIENLF